MLEVRKKKGEEFPLTPSPHMLRDHEAPKVELIDLFADSDFADFKATLDSEMKRLQSKGIGSQTKQAEIFLGDEEELLWEGGFLGDGTPQSLLDTMVYCISRTSSAPVSSMSNRKTRRK